MKEIDKIRSIYRTALAAHGDSPSSVCWPKGRQDLRFEKLLEPAFGQKGGMLSLCDFGCGLGHMEEYLKQKKISNLSYSGFDTVPELVTKARDLGRNVKFIGHDSVLTSRYDCVVASGVFNLAYFDDPKQNQTYILERIDMLLKASKVYFACDFMRPDVDYAQRGAWHQPYDVLISHLSKYSRDIDINMRTLPFEYTVRVFLDA